MTSLLQRFIPEAREHLESAATGLLKLERNPADHELVNEVFRALHTLKGASGLFDVPGLTRLVHAGEDVLGAVREDDVRISADMVDLLLDALDWVSAWIDSLEKENRLPENADSISASLALRLRALLPASDQKAVALVSAEVAGLADWVESLPGHLKDDLRGELRRNPNLELFTLDYTPDDGCFFQGEDPFNLVQQSPGLRALSVTYTGPGSGPLDDVDPYRCAVTFRAIVGGARHEIEHLFRYVIEQVRLLPLPAEALDQSMQVATEPKSVAGRILAAQLQILALANSGVDEEPRLCGVEAIVCAVIRGCGMADKLAEVQQAAAAARRGEKSGLHALIAALIRDIESGSQAKSQSKEVSGEGGTQQRLPDVRATAAAVELTRESTAAAPLEARHSKVLKVDQGKIDVLMNLIGELVVSKNSLPFLAKRAEENFGSREMSREIKDQYAVIDRLAQELQRAIMDVRMLPVSEVFDRFPRLVRDLARKLEKRIELKMEGQETAADKTIIEALADPLIHLVRNSLDHGIEASEEERLACGKPAVATIHLRARQEADQVVIEVADDGKGICPDKIKSKALEKGLISVDAAAQLSQSEAINLVFLPGFSTAAEISDLSGRGVGMDVVRTAIEKINGRIELTSNVNVGTCVRLSLPLSMAVTRVMMVEVAGGLFGIPIDSVIETVRIRRVDIKRIKAAEAFVHRGSIVPLLRMQQLLQMTKDGQHASDEEAVVVSKVGSVVTGLVVDRFREGIDVILKPLDGILAGARGFAGSALLGDGRVLLVLNLKEIL